MREYGWNFFDEQQLAELLGGRVCVTEQSACLSFSEWSESDGALMGWDCHLQGSVCVVCLAGRLEVGGPAGEFELGPAQGVLMHEPTLRLGAQPGSRFVLLDKRHAGSDNSFEELLYRVFSLDLVASQIFVNQVESFMMWPKVGESYPVFDAMVGQMFSSLLESCRLSLLRSDPESRQQRYLRDLRMAVCRCFKSQKGSEFYASKVGLSSKHLNRLAEAQCGKTVRRLVEECVTSEIKSMLRYSQLTELEIASKVGLMNASFLTQYFKRTAGMKPGEYRKGKMF